jgi:precorrin isomerase
MKTKEEREVTPQFGGAGNLGVYAITPTVFDVEALRSASQDDSLAKAMAHLLNSQCHIAFSGRMVYDQVREALEKKHGEPEAKKLKEWHVTHYAEAKELAKEVVATTDFDYVSEFRRWATEVFAKRGTAQSKKPVLAQYDGVEKGIRTKWDNMSVMEQQKVIDSLKLNITTAATTEQALAALEAKYARPVAVDVEGLFATE